MNTVMFDIGETLVDETRLWAGWADWLGVPAFTLYGVLGGLAARGEDHRRFVELLDPRATFEDERAAKEAAGRGWSSGVDLYPDALPCLRELHDDGWRLIVGGNQPATFQRLVEELALPVDVVVSSGGLGVEKPDPAFFVAAAAAAGVHVSDCVHVGDRVDNDIVAARAAGMRPVHVRRGPWGVLHAHDPAIEVQVSSLTELPALLRTWR
jgi:HAD superfamily hydrolase (TIGR01549 family)